MSYGEEKSMCTHNIVNSIRKTLDCFNFFIYIPETQSLRCNSTFFFVTVQHLALSGFMTIAPLFCLNTPNREELPFHLISSRGVYGKKKKRDGAIKKSCSLGSYFEYLYL